MGAPETGLHDFVYVLVAHLVHAAPDRATGIVEPGITAVRAQLAVPFKEMSGEVSGLILLR